MLDFLKNLGRNKTSHDGDSQNIQDSANSAPRMPWLSRLTLGLGRTRDRLQNGLTSLFQGKNTIDENLLQELEAILLSADLGPEVTEKVMEDLQKHFKQRTSLAEHDLETLLKSLLEKILLPFDKPFELSAAVQKPYLILILGVNGAGKTTSIAKIAHRLQSEGKKVMLAAGDTFRAAAIEQLKIWGERLKIPVVAQASGADSASVIFDAYQAAKARGMDVLIADTAGRLHTQGPLMEELKKIVRVIKKMDETAPHSVMLVLDAGIGQNAFNQVKTFNQAIPLTGLIMTKLDGTAKGGIIFNLVENLKLPIQFIGVGEGLEDLRTFKAQDFVQALFVTDENVNKNEKGEV